MNLKIIFSLSSIIIILILFILSKNSYRYRNLLGLFGLFLSSLYIIWRVFFTLPNISTIDFIFAFLLIFFETISLGQNIVLRLLFSRHQPMILERTRLFNEKPTIDIIISTYNETPEILERTIVGCLNIIYPKNKLNIYLGDDGKRSEIKNLCSKYQINYITRNDNENAKAGNINNVLKTANGEFVLLLDADMIPKDSIITAMLDYFEDESTGFVQSPQVFYNLDPFQYNLGIGLNIPNEQDFFMRTMQEKRAIFNSVLHVGTNALFRREAINTIGGIPIGSITEDMATGMLIQNAGYKSFFVKDTLAIGLTVENFEDLIKQRDRWCRGNTQVIKKFNPLKMKNLTISQKLIYLDGFFYWMFGIQKMVYILSPLLFLLFRVIIFTASGFDLVLIFLPHFISTSLYFKTISGKERNTIWSHIYDTAMAPRLSFSFITEFLFSRDVKFNVTPKGTTKSKNEFKLKLAFIHIFLFLASVIALIININLISFGNPGIYLTGIVINIIWCVYNMSAIFIAIFLSLEKRRFRKTERTPTNLAFSILSTSSQKFKKYKHIGYVKDFSEKGMLINLKGFYPHFPFSVGEDILLDIDAIGEVEGKISRFTERDSIYNIGINFKESNFDLISISNKYRFDLKNKYVKNPVIQDSHNSIFEILNKTIKNVKNPQ